MKSVIKHAVPASLLPFGFYVYAFSAGTRHDIFAMEMYTLLLATIYFIAALILYFINVHLGKVFMVSVGMIFLFAMIARELILLK
ncbi:hypothetical protein [Chitinophaga sp.]|uniref:hypothetical protein n=1 Tax=Chitinophaga sp. TaxID=1869181 RepID=UPI002F92B851